MSHTAAWDYLHDGSLDRAEGTVPGDLALSISIPYLRRASSLRAMGSCFC